jgi:hypothetical protein
MTDKDPAARPTAADVGVAVTGLAEAPPPVATPVVPHSMSATSDSTTIAFPPDSAFPEEMPRPNGAPLEQRAAATQVLRIPKGGGAARTGLRRRLWPLVAAALAAVVLAVLIVVVASSDDGKQAPPTPSYPTVPGQLGSHLRELQQEVAP